MWDDLVSDGELRMALMGLAYRCTESLDTFVFLSLVVEPCIPLKSELKTKVKRAATATIRVLNNMVESHALAERMQMDRAFHVLAYQALRMTTRAQSRGSLSRLLSQDNYYRTVGGAVNDLLINRFLLSTVLGRVVAWVYDGVKVHFAKEES